MSKHDDVLQSQHQCTKALQLKFLNGDDHEQTRRCPPVSASVHKGTPIEISQWRRLSKALDILKEKCVVNRVYTLDLGALGLGAFSHLDHRFTAASCPSPLQSRSVFAHHVHITAQILHLLKCLLFRLIRCGPHEQLQGLLV